MGSDAFEIYISSSLEGEKTIQELRSSNNVTLLIGSAVSLFSPTSIPTGKSLTDDIISLLLSQLESSAEVQLIKNFLTMPFEYLCDYCPSKDTLEDILIKEFYPKQPNKIHGAIAHLVQANIVKHIITTNYDTCLEELLPDGKPLQHIALEKDASNISPQDRLLFKIHGSALPEHKGSMVFSLRQEGVLPEWKRKLLFNILTGSKLLVIGYSGLDFEICPEITIFKPNSVIWNFLDNPASKQSKREQFSENSTRVLSQCNGVALIDDLRIVLSKLSSQDCNTSFSPRSNFLIQLQDKFTNQDKKLWAGWVLSNAGYGKQAEKLAKSLLQDAKEIDSALALHLLADALFWRGKYISSAKQAHKAGQIYLRYHQNDKYFDTVIREIDSFRCAGRFTQALNIISTTRKIIGNLLNDGIEIYKARLNIYEAMIVRENYIRAKQRADEASINAFRSAAKSLLKEAADVVAREGRWHDLQTCKIWANRMQIPFEEVYDGSLQPLDDWSGFRQLGHVVVEMMAARDSFWRSPTPLVDVDALRNYVWRSRIIGSLSEQWKLLLTIQKYFGRRSGYSQFSWILPFLQCEYTLEMRIFKLLNEEYR